MGVDINFEGISDLTTQLELMAENSKAVINHALESASEPILSDAKMTTAFTDRSGKLRKSLIISKTQTKKGKTFILVGTFNKDVFYACMVEYGTSHAPAHPFLGPAFERNKNKAYDIIKTELTEALK